MSRTALRRTLAVAATTAAMTAVVAAPSPALAGSSFFSKSSGTLAATSWLEVGELPPAANAPGNAHFGDLIVEDLGRGRTNVFGTVYDVQCEPGTVPYNPGGGHGGGHGEPPPEGPCVLVGTRFIEGGSLTFSIDRKLSRATLTGTLAVGSGHGGPTGSPAVDVTWTGIGETYSSTERGTFTDSSGTYSYRYSFTGRQAAIAAGSRIGPMVFDDEAGEYSDGSLGRYRSASRGRS